MATDDEVPSRGDLFRRYRGKPAIQITDVENEEDALGPSGIDEETIKDKRADRALRIVMAIALTLLFIALNAVVVYMLFDAVWADRAMLAAKLVQPTERLITDKVYMSLIGGTVLQVAAIVIAIARYLFPATKDD